MKKTTDGLGVDVAIDAVGGDAKGNFLQTLFGDKLKLEAGNAIPPLGDQLGEEGRRRLDRRRLRPDGQHGPARQYREQGPDDPRQPGGGEAPRPQAHRACEGRAAQPQGIITHRVPLEDIADAYHIFSAKLDNCIKPVLMPNG
jgi:threonine dehydrogenase-like Zn-dependent dehydrogenase